MNLEHGYSDIDDRSAFLSNRDTFRVPTLCSKILIHAQVRGYILSPANGYGAPLPPNDHPERRKARDKFAVSEGPLPLPEREDYAWTAYTISNPQGQVRDMSNCNLVQMRITLDKNDWTPGTNWHFCNNCSRPLSTAKSQGAAGAPRSGKRLGKLGLKPT